MKNKNFLKKLAAVTLGFIMTLGVGAAGYSAAASETHAATTTYTFTSKSDPSGLTSSPAAGSFESASPSRAAQWSNNQGLTLTTSSSFTNVSKVTLVTSTNANNDAYSISCTVGGTSFGDAISLQKANNQTLTFTQTTQLSGAVVISYTLKGTKKSIYVKSITVETSDVVHTVSISNGPDSIYKGNTGLYSATCSPTGDTVSKWEIINANPAGCAEIGQSTGVVVAKEAGTATVKVTSSGSVSATKNITITDNILSLSPAIFSGVSGDVDTFVPSFTTEPDGETLFEFESSDTDVAYIDENTGEVMLGDKIDSATITCTALTEAGVIFEATATAICNPSGAHASLQADKSSTYYTGDTYVITAAFSGIEQANTAIRMSYNGGSNVDQTNKASISGTFENAGSYRFVVINKNDNDAEISDPLIIDVSQSQVTSVVIKNQAGTEEVSSLSFTLPDDQSKTVTLTAVVTGVGNFSHDVTWSSNSAKVTVSSSGVVAPVGKVTGAIITASAGGQSDTVTVNVAKNGDTESVTFADCGYSNQQVITTYNFTNSTVTFDKGSNSNKPQYFTSGTAIRLYGGGLITVESSTLNMVKIELIYGSSDGNNAFSTDVGDFNEANGVGTWIGTAKKVVFTEAGTTGNRRIAGINVTYEAEADISSIALTGSYKQAYATNEKFNPSGIGVTVNYEEGDPKTDSYASHASKFTFYKSNSFVDANKLTTDSSINGVTKVYVVYDGKTEFAQSYDVTVTSHTITVNSAGGATSVLAKSTLQMSATHDAGGLGDDAITWSVKANDGTSSTTAASINASSGLLTGGTVTSATTVTVIATCKYGGSGSKKITINPHTITLTGESQAVINRSYSFSVAHDGTDTVSYKVVKPDNTELSPAITTNSFTPTSIGIYKITASCSCCSSSNELQVTVGYAAVSSVVAKYNDAVTDAVSCLTNVTISNFSAVVYDDQGESNTVSQEIVWSIDYTDERTTLTSSEVTFVPSTHSFSSTAAGTAVLLATAKDTNISAAIVITVDAVSASITYEGNPLEVWYGESPKILTAVGQGFTSPRYSWDVAWEGEGEAPVEVTGSSTSPYGTLIYNGVTPVGGVTVKVTISEADDSSIVAEASVNVVVKSSGVDSIKIKQNGADVSKEAIELWDNGQTASFSYDISSHGIVSDTAVWSASDGYADVLSYSVNDGVITVTTNNKISANKTVRLTATNTSTYGDPSVVSEYVDVLVKKSTVSVTLPEEMPSIYNGQSATTAVTVGSTGNVPAAQNTVTFSKSSDNASGVNDKVTLTPNGLSCTIAVAADYPISTSSTFKVTVTSDYDNSSQDIAVTVLQSKVEGFDILDSDNKSISSKTVYASATDKNEVQLKATMSLSGSATGNVTWSFSDGDSPAIDLDKYSSTNGELITVTTNPNYDFGGNNSHTVKLTATSDYDNTQKDTINIVVNREYVTALTWNNGASVDNFAGTSIGASSWTFDATYNSSKSETGLAIGNDASHVHVYAVDDATSVTEEPTDLTPISSSATLSAELNGKQLVAFYKGYKCASTYELTSTGLLHEVWETKQVVDSGTKTTGDIGSKVKTDKAAIFTEDGTETVGDLSLTLSTTGTDVYFGYDSTDTNKGQQIGSGKCPANTVSLSTSVSGTITQVVVETSGAKDINASLSVSVGGTDFKCNNETSVSITATKTSYTFTGSGTGTISINWSNSSSKAIYFSKVDVTYNNSHQETNQIANTNLAAQKAVIKYAEWFNQYGNESDWSTASSKYTEYVTGALTGDALTCAKAMFKNAVHTGSDLDVLQECVEAYDQIMYKNPAYANFMERTIAATFVVTIDLDDGSDPTTQKVAAGSTFTLPEAPKGGDFSNWDVDGVSKLPGDEITITKNVTIKAVYNETLSVSTDLAFQFTGLTMKKGQIKFSVNFTKADKAKEYGFLVTTNLSNDPTSLSAEDVYGKTVSGYSKVVGKTTAGVASSNLQLEMKVVFYYIDENNQIHLSEVVVTSFEDLAREYDSKTITDQYARACFEYYVSTLDEKAE